MTTKGKLKILMITVRADYGGGPEHLYQLLNLNSDNGLVVAAPNDEPYFEKYKRIVGSRNIIKIPHRKFSLIILLELIKFVKKNQISIVHSHGKGAGIYSRLITLFTKVKCIHTFHGIHIGNYGFLSRILYLYLERILSLITDRFITVSKSERSKILRLKITQENKIALIENGVNIPKDSIRPELKYKSNKILQVSRFDFAKNSLLLLDIVNELNKKKDEEKFEFHIIGDGPDRILLENKFKDKGISNVVFHGFQGNLTKYYSDSFCYISTSRWEGLPLTLLESMSHGTPSIVTKVDGNKDLVSHGQNGYLFNINSPQEAADFILKLKNDKELYQDLSKNAKQLIADNFSIVNMIKQTENLYLSLV